MVVWYVSQQPVRAEGCRFFWWIRAAHLHVRPAFLKPGHRLQCVSPGSEWGLLHAADNGLYGRDPAGYCSFAIRRGNGTSGRG